MRTKPVIGVVFLLTIFQVFEDCAYLAQFGILLRLRMQA